MPTVPMEITWKPAWLTWVGSVTTCLDALGVEVEPAEVAGVSGYAFALSINRGLCPSGPTCVDWTALATGISPLGRAPLVFNPIDCFTDGHRNDRTTAHARLAFEIASREVEAGRPCVVWGLGVPEFGVVRGVEGDEYVCVAAGGTPERVRWDALDAPGGPYVLAFPTETVPLEWRHRFAIGRAIDMMTCQPSWGALRCGAPAYDRWIETLTAKQAVRMGNAYNAQCWAEARAHARDYLTMLAAQRHDIEPLADARAAFAESAVALGAVAETFPFNFEPETVDDDDAIEAAVGPLRVAKESDARALAALREAVDVWPEDEE